MTSLVFFFFFFFFCHMECTVFTSSACTFCTLHYSFQKSLGQTIFPIWKLSWTLAGVGYLLPSITEVWMTLDEANSVTRKKSVMFRNPPQTHTHTKKKKRKKKGRKKLNLSSVESLWGQSKCLNVPGIWTYLAFELTWFELIHCFYLTKKKKSFDEDMMNAWTHPAFELIRLELTRCFVNAWSVSKELFFKAQSTV